MGGGWNYKRLNLTHHKHRNLSQLREERLEEQNKRAYLECLGTFDDCPPEAEFNAAVEKDKSNPPDRCKRCPIFRESEFYKPVVDAARIALWEKLKATKE